MTRRACRVCITTKGPSMKSFSGWLATALLAAGLATGSGTLGPWRNVLSLPLGSRVLTAVSCPSSRVCEAVGVTASRVYGLDPV